MKYYCLLLPLVLFGCSSTGYSSGYGNYDSTRESPTYIRNTKGQTVAKVQDGMIYNTRGVRVGSIKK